jgi:lipase
VLGEPWRRVRERVEHAVDVQQEQRPHHPRARYREKVMSLNTYEFGAPDGTPVVCLHGVTSYGGRFDWLAAPGRRVLSLDLLGHGHSSWEPPWDIDAHLAAILASVPDGPLAWVGHSFGGRLAAELAAREPERVERLVLLDPALQVLPHVAFDLAEAERADASFETVEEAVEARYTSGRVLLSPRDRVIASDTGHMEPGRDGRFRYRYCKSAVIAAWSIMATPPPAPARVPTLFVLGADSWLTPGEHLDTYRDLLGDLCEVVTVPGGHTVYWDALDETREAVERFLEDPRAQS